MFIGRQNELRGLEALRQKKTASLVCILGRRRIGKSILVEQFSKPFKKKLFFQGLGPDEDADLKIQLKHFSKQLSEQTNTREKHFVDWEDAFNGLTEYIKKNEVLIFFDEISWMAQGDRNFAAKLKDSWDRKIKKNPNAILILCGSVSAWIQDNILQNANFEGRISLKIELKELSWIEINEFLRKKGGHFHGLEKILLASVTGGVPKYLEEIYAHESVENNLLRLCFDPSGILFNDYEYIFSSVLGRRTKTMEKIIRQCLTLKLTPSELSKKIKQPLNGDLTRNLQILDLSGFLSRDVMFLPNGKMAKISNLRVKDNYLRFYLKVIEPLKQKILKGGKRLQSLHDIKGFDGILGLQFENLILQNRDLIQRELQISDSQLVCSAPFLQRKTSENKGACQIDLMIQTSLDVIFVCEIKCLKSIGKSILHEMKKKISTLELPKRTSIKPVLIYEGEIADSARDEIEQYFFKIIHFSSIKT